MLPADYLIIDLAATISDRPERSKMITSWAHTTIDQRIVHRIEEISAGNSDYWSFRKSARRGGAHGLIQYPAMMIPSMQGQLLEIVSEAHENVRSVLDPFVGGGTMLTETMELGLDFTGFDINPLAILACKVKAGPFPTAHVGLAVEHVLSRIAADARRNFEVTFEGQHKWFSRGASIGLSRIRRAITECEDLWMRRFSWLAMAETIRRCSNSRTSTYKLHVRPEHERTSKSDIVLQTFSDVMTANARKIEDQKTSFSNRELLEQGHYKGQVGVIFQDVAKLDELQQNTQHQLLFTSPPYGDNTTTIPYGQFSYLALNWIPLIDIDPAIPPDLNKNTHAIDTASIGGSLKGADVKAEELAVRSRTFRTFLEEIEGVKTSHGKRLSSFCFDLDRCVRALAKQVEENGYMVWTLGNRSLAGRRVPLDEIVWDLLEGAEISRVAQFTRPIPSKRMPARNGNSETMDREIVLIGRA